MAVRHCWSISLLSGEETNCAPILRAASIITGFVKVNSVPSSTVAGRLVRSAIGAFPEDVTFTVTEVEADLLPPFPLMVSVFAPTVSGPVGSSVFQLLSAIATGIAWYLLSLMASSRALLNVRAATS
jgi:hypothetical protein